MFNEHLRPTAAGRDRGHGDFVLMLVDLDKFRCINDSLGHDVGDMVPVEVARRLQGLVRETDLAADQALYRAKVGGRGAWRWHEIRMAAHADARGIARILACSERLLHIMDSGCGHDAGSASSGQSASHRRINWV
jgi:predicted signal transduction protein with EAL and GGDEF domain